MTTSLRAILGLLLAGSLIGSGLIGCVDDPGGDSDNEDGSGANGSGAGGPSGGSGGDGGTGGDGGSGGTPLPCGSFPSFEDGLAPTTEIHVAVNGSDGSGNGSAGSPFATIYRAVEGASPGTAIVVHAGTYAGDTYIGGLEGTAEAPIWIGGAAGEARPVLQGGANGIHMSRVRHLVIHDLEITGGTANGINCDDAGDYDNEDATRHVVFRGLDIHDIGSGGNNDCLKLSGVNDFLVVDSSFARCGGNGSAIDHVGCHRGIVAASTFTENSANSVQCKGGSEDILITANHFVDAGERAVNLGGSTGFEYFRPSLSMGQPNVEARNIRLVANLIEGSDSAFSFVGCVDCLAANNTLIDPTHWVMRILQETTSSGGYDFLPASDGRVINNIIYFSSSAVGTHVNVGPDTDAGSFVFQTNLWYAHDAPGNSTPNLPVAETGGLVGVDPMFMGTADFHLQAGSPAAAAGTDLGELAGDYDGACFAAAPSIGAYQP